MVVSFFEFELLAAVPFELLLLFELFDDVDKTDVVDAFTAADAVATPARVAAADAGGAALVVAADVSVEPPGTLVLFNDAPAPITPAFDDDDVSFKCNLDADALLDDESAAPLPP